MSRDRKQGVIFRVRKELPFVRDVDQKPHGAFTAETQGNPFTREHVAGSENPKCRCERQEGLFRNPRTNGPEVRFSAHFWSRRGI